MSRLMAVIMAMRIRDGGMAIGWFDVGDGAAVDLSCEITSSEIRLELKRRFTDRINRCKYGDRVTKFKYRIDDKKEIISVFECAVLPATERPDPFVMA